MNPCSGHNNNPSSAATATPFPPLCPFPRIQLFLRHRVSRTRESLFSQTKKTRGPPCLLSPPPARTPLWRRDSRAPFLATPAPARPPTRVAPSAPLVGPPVCVRAARVINQPSGGLGVLGAPAERARRPSPRRRRRRLIIINNHRLPGALGAPRPSSHVWAGDALPTPSDQGVYHDDDARDCRSVCVSFWGGTLERGAAAAPLPPRRVAQN